MNRYLKIAFLLLSLLKMYNCDGNSEIQKQLNEQNVKYKYEENLFIIEDVQQDITLSIKDEILTSPIKISSPYLIMSLLQLQNIFINNKTPTSSLFRSEQYQNMVIRELKFSNVSSNCPIFSFEKGQLFLIESAQIINSQLTKGLGIFSKINQVVLLNNVVDGQTLDELDYNFIQLIGILNFILNNSYFGDIPKFNQDSQIYLDFSSTHNNTLNYRDNHRKVNASELNDKANKFLNFIESFPLSPIDKTTTLYVSIINTKADFQNQSMRFFKVNDDQRLQFNVSQSLFRNMQSSDSGGCLSLQGITTLKIEDTLFDSCQSGMFGGAFFCGRVDIKPNVTISNCKAKIGGAAFTSFGGCEVMGILNIQYFNNFATISSPNIYIGGMQPNDKGNKCNVFEFDSLFQYNIEFSNTPIFLKGLETNFVQKHAPDYISYESNLNNGISILIRLRVEYQDYKISEFSDNQYIGNLYQFVVEEKKQYFYPFLVQGINYPYLITMYSPDLDCAKNYLLFQLQYFQDDHCGYNDRRGCFNLSQKCQNGMEQIKLLQSEENICQYCGYGQYNIDSSQKCKICNQIFYSQCYANYTTLNNQYWKKSNSDINDVYFCQLNKNSCNGANRQSFGNDLCSEGYIGDQCLSCDIHGEYWKGESFGKQGLFQCVNCKNLKYNSLFIYFTLGFVMLLYLLTVNSSQSRMKGQIFRQYLSYMKIVYIGSSFIRQNQTSIYIKILLFNFQIYLLTYYFVDFNQYDSSLHSNIYSYVNPLQSQGSTSLDCFLNQYFPNEESYGYIKLMISTISPLVLIILTLIVLLIISFMRRKNYFCIAIHSTAYIIIFIFQSSIIQNSIESLTCLQLTNEDQYLMIDTRINCKNEEWMPKMRAFSIPAIVIYIIFTPLSFFAFVFYSRHSLDKIKTLLFFGFLYDEFKKQFYYWQFIKIILTISLTILVTIGKTSIIFSSLIYCGILSIYFASIFICQPFQQLNMNRLESISISLSILYILASISLELVYSNSDQYEVTGYSKITANIFYYLILICQLLFYAYTIILIISSFFYLSIQKLQKFQCFQKLTQWFPCTFSKVYSKNLRDNFKKMRLIVGIGGKLYQNILQFDNSIDINEEKINLISKSMTKNNINNSSCVE